MRTRILAMLSGLLLLLAAGCDTAASPAGGMTLEIVGPKADAVVATPFTVRVRASVPLGTTGSGRHHIHVWFDGDADNYQVVEADQVEIPSGSLPPGRHVIHASLRNANHSAAGVETEVAVTTTAGGGPAATPAPSDGGDGY